MKHALRICTSCRLSPKDPEGGEPLELFELSEIRTLTVPTALGYSGYSSLTYPDARAAKMDKPERVCSLLPCLRKKHDARLTCSGEIPLSTVVSLTRTVSIACHCVEPKLSPEVIDPWKWARLTESNLMNPRCILSVTIGSGI